MPARDERPHAGRPDRAAACRPAAARAAADCQRLRAMVDTAAVGLVLHDAHGRIVDFNAEAGQLLGLGHASHHLPLPLAAQWPARRRDGSLLPTAQHPAMRALRSGRPARRQILGLHRADGGLRWLQVSSQPLADGGPEPMAVSSLVDVTAQQLLRADLGEERLRLSAALEGTQAGVWVWDLATNLLHCDARGAAALGMPAEDPPPIDSQDFVEMMHPDDQAPFAAALRAHLRREREAFDIEVRLRHLQGLWVWVRLTGRVADRAADGRALRMVGTQVDITARKEAEAANQRAHEQLRGLFTLSPLGIGLRDMVSGRFVEVNDALVSITGYGRDELLALDEDALTADAWREASQLQHQCLLSTGRYGPYEKEITRKDGRRVQVLDSGMHVAQPDGRQLAWTIVQDISPRKALELELRSAARTDRLTGLPNRELLMERLELAVAGTRSDRRRHFALLFLDFDRFKLVNDSLGHEAGDDLLRQIAERLRGTLRASDVIGSDPRSNLVTRFGGDEFVVLLNDVARHEEAAAVAERLLGVFAVPFQVRDKEIHSSVSIGIVMGGADSEGAEGLLRNADTAMYEAKRAGRGRAVFFDEGMHVRLARALTLETELRQAVERQQFSLVYQPIVDLTSGQVSSCEALLRWQHPELGQVSPAEFIPVAEESGLIVPIGEWVLREACAQWARWQAERPDLVPDTLSVNLSRVQMNQPDRLVAAVDRVLRELGMPPGRLQLEVTEREVMHDANAMRALMHRLRALGVRLAMDDFGTGTSSLGCLRDYPFDVVKIDKSFLADLQSSPDVMAVLHATVTVIENLGMSSVAEGVEDEAQVVMLQSIGCRHAQGYLFARPLRGEQVLALVQSRRQPVAA